MSAVPPDNRAAPEGSGAPPSPLIPVAQNSARERVAFLWCVPTRLHPARSPDEPTIDAESAGVKGAGGRPKSATARCEKCQTGRRACGPWCKGWQALYGSASGAAETPQAATAPADPVPAESGAARTDGDASSAAPTRRRGSARTPATRDLDAEAPESSHLRDHSRGGKRRLEPDLGRPTADKVDSYYDAEEALISCLHAPAPTLARSCICTGILAGPGRGRRGRGNGR